MNTKKISQRVAEFVENLLQEELENEIVNDNISSDYHQAINEEQEAFEQGIDDDEFVMDMSEDDINNETMNFLKLRDKK